ncbi:MAG: hypothetical protein RQM92_12850 [Candidatus Syntrophopropionicum ammoniitolerans]
MAADTPELATEALGLIEIEWEELPLVLDPLEALKPGAPLAAEEINNRNNIIRKLKVEHGDVEKGFKEADKVIKFDARRRPYTVADAESHERRYSMERRQRGNMGSPAASL